MANKLIQDLGAGAFALTDLLEHQPIAGPPSLKGDVAALVTLLNTIYAPITGGAYVLKAGDTMTGLLTIAQATANTSNLILSGQSLTGANAQSLLTMAGTWNTSGTPTAVTLRITDTASNAASAYLEIFGGAAGATSQLILNKGQGLVVAMGISTGGNFFGTYYQAPVTGAFYWTASSVIRGATDGIVTLLNQAETSFGRLQFGGTAATFPSIKRSTTILQARLADDSAFGTYQGIIQVSVNATATAPPVTTHTIPFVDAAGVTYRVPCLV